MGSAVIGALRVNLSIDSAEFKRGLTAAEQMLARFDRALTSALKTGLVAFAGGVTVAATALVGMTKSSMDTISAQVDLSRRVGGSVAAIQTLQYQANLAGASNEALTKTVETLNQRLGEAAREGAGPAYEALKRLGLSANELSRMDVDERIKAISDRMAELGYTTQQQADTLRDLGVKQKEIINLFQEGSGAIDQVRGELKAWGVLLSDVDAAKVEAAGDAWDKIGVVLQGVGNQLAVRLSPLIQAAAEYISDAAKNTHGFGDAIDAAVNLAIRLMHGLNVEWNDFLRSIYMTGDALTEFVNNAAKPGQGLLRRLLGMDEIPESEITGLLDNIWKPLLVELGTPPSMEEWDKWWADLKAKAEAAAKAAAASRPGGFGDGDDGQTEAAAKAQAKLQEQLALRLETLREALMTEEEQEMASYDNRLAELEEYYAQGAIDDTEYYDLLRRNAQDHARSMKAIQDDITKNQQRAMQMQSRAVFAIADDIGSALNSIFGENKLVAIAQAVVNTAQAVTKALAEYGPTPLGWAAAAAAAAAGTAQIATIRSTSSRGGGGGGGGRGGSGGSSQSESRSQPAQQAPQAAQGQTVFINGISPGQIFTGEALRGLMEQIVDAQRDGGKIVLGPA